MWVDDLPEAVLRKVRALGAAGAAWLDALPSVVDDLAREWLLEIGAVLPGGSGGLVVEVMRGDTPAVLKVAIPDGLEGHGEFASELAALLAADPRGSVSVLAHDAARRAILLERLGARLESLGLSVEEQIDAIADTLALAWRVPERGLPVRSGADQARWLEDFVVTRWRALHEPCSAGTIERAVECARNRHAAVAAADRVLVHGDAHPANVLQAPSAPTGFKLIDPSAMMSTADHDLGVTLRGWPNELLAGDAVTRLSAWCHRASDRTDVDVVAIWEWALLERVASGLFLLELGDALGPPMLAVADRLQSVDP